MLNSLTSRRPGYFLGFAVCAGLMAYAFYLQYALDIEPCPLCMFQRVALVAMGVVFLIATLHGPAQTGAWIYGVLQLILGGTGIGLALRHLWIQSLPPDQVPACGMGIGYMFETLPFFDVIARTLKGSAECAHIDRVLGLPIPAWNLGVFAALIVWSLLLAAKPSR